jgi:hypothetical protein
MANPPVIAQLQQLAGQLNDTLQQTIRNLQASNTTLTQELQPWKLKTPPSLPLTQPSWLKLPTSQEAAAGGTAGGSAGTAPVIVGGSAGAAPLVTFAATPVMVNHQDLINYSTKLGTTIYNEGC